MEPSPYEFGFKFEDAMDPHDYANGDWETPAIFCNGRRREGSDHATFESMSGRLNDKHPRKAMLFCVGTVARRSQAWQLQGVLRVDDTAQL